MHELLEITASVLALAAAFAAGWLCHRPRPVDPEWLERRLDDVYDQGWEARDAEVAEMRDLREADHPAPGSYLAGARALPPAVPAADWHTEMMEALDPERLDAEAADFPGPVSEGPATTTVRMSADAGTSRAGELHDWPTDMRLPAVLNLGTPGDGSDRTFARWQLARWDFVARMQAEAEEVDRMLKAAA